MKETLENKFREVNEKLRKNFNELNPDEHKSEDSN